MVNYGLDIQYGEKIVLYRINKVYRFQPSRAADNTFGTNGAATLSRGVLYSASLALQADGKIVVCGHSSPIGSAGDTYFAARLHPDGNPDTRFGTNGEVSYDFNTYDIPWDIA